MDINEKTKRKFANTIKALMETTPLDKITVKDIVSHCDMTRQTFYRHFKDKYDLVNWHFEQLVKQSFKQMGVSLTLKEGLIKKFEFIQNELVFFYGAFKSNDYNSLINYDYECIYAFYENIIKSKTGGVITEEIAFLLRMYCRGSIYMTVEWVNEKSKLTPNQMAELLIEAMPKRLNEFLSDLQAKKEKANE